MVQSDRYFSNKTLSLMGTVRGSSVSVTANAIVFLLNLAKIAVLARLLTPDDFGLFAIASVFTSTIGLSRGIGLTQGTIQSDTIGHAEVSNVFWVNLGVGVVVAICVAGLSPFVAGFYQRPELIGILWALGAHYLLIKIPQQHQAIMQRQMMFNRLAVVVLGNQIANVAVSILCAWMGLAYWSLLFGLIAGAVTIILFSIFMLPWFPSWFSRDVSVMDLVRFGRNVQGYEFMRDMGMKLNRLIIGRIFGAASLGFYSRAETLMALPMLQINMPLTKVVLPALSRLQDNPRQFERFYLGAIQVACIATMPSLAVLIACSSIVIRIALGPGWDESADIFFWLGFAGMFQSLYHSLYWLYVPQGRTRELFFWGLGSCVATIALLLSGMPFGVEGMACCYGLGHALIITPISILFCCRRGPVSAGGVFRTAAPAATAGLVLLTVLLLAREYGVLPENITGLLVASLICGTIQLALFMVSDTGNVFIGRLRQYRARVDT